MQYSRVGVYWVFFVGILLPYIDKYLHLAVQIWGLLTDRSQGRENYVHVYVLRAEGRAQHHNIKIGDNFFYFKFSPFSEICILSFGLLPFFWNLCASRNSCLHHVWRCNRQSVPQRRHIKFRRRGITQKKEYNKIYSFKVWNISDIWEQTNQIKFAFIEKLEQSEVRESL